jgi:hypothetical protein
MRDTARTPALPAGRAVTAGVPQSVATVSAVTAWLAFGVAALELTVGGISLGLTLYLLKTQRERDGDASHQEGDEVI